MTNNTNRGVDAARTVGLLTLVPAILQLGFGACVVGPPNGVLAGAASVDITPLQWPLPMIGSFRYRPAESAHDPLHARAIALRSGDSTVAIAVVDSCYIPRETVDRAKQRVAEDTGLDASRILVSATHTHSAPPSAPGAGLRGLEGQPDLKSETAYVERLVEGIATAIADSLSRLEPAEVGWATTALPDEVFNRRWFMKEGSVPPDPFGGTTDKVRMNPGFENPGLVRPAGPVDSEVAVLSVRSLTGRPIALLTNYSLHYVGGVPAGQVSADYFGEFARLIEDRIGQDDGFVAILSNGTSADVNNLNFTQARARREPFEQIRLVASKLADVVTEACNDLEHQRQVDVAMEESEVQLARRKPSPEILDRSLGLLADPPADATVRQRVYAQRAVDLHRGPGSVSVVLQAIRIGPVGIAALPFETFTETGLAIKQLSPLKPTFTISLANGAEGYLPTPEQHEVGGYETWLGTSRVEPQSSVRIQSELLALLGRVSSGGAR